MPDKQGSCPCCTKEHFNSSSAYGLYGRSIMEALRNIIPHRFEDLLLKEWIPWDWVDRCYSDLNKEHLTALFEAYRFLSGEMDLDSLSDQDIQDDSSGCLRCGWCCTYLKPGFVSSHQIRKWRMRGALVAEFYRPVGEGKSTRYGCWFSGQIRLRICPFMFRNRRDRNVFCSIHHMGSKFRPATCRRFQPNPPDCATFQLAFLL